MNLLRPDCPLRLRLWLWLLCLPLGGGIAHAAAPTFLLKWGTAGTGDGQFNDPTTVAVDASGDVFVADYASHRIQKFTATGTFLLKWGVLGAADGEFNLPVGVIVGASGEVYVGDSDNNRVQVFDTAGTFTRKWGTAGTANGEFDRPHTIAFDTAGNVYVADHENHRIQKFDNTGTFLLQWGGLGTGDGQFNLPWSVVIDANDNVFVADQNNNRVQKFTTAGVFVTKWGTGGTGDGQFNLTAGLAVAANGNVFVSDRMNHRIQEFTTTGAFVSKFGAPGTGDGQFNQPSGLAFDTAGNLYVADHLNDRIQVFAPAPAGTAPAIAAQPQSASQLAGGSVSLVVTANGTFPLAHQWFFTNGPVPGATSPTLTFNPAQVTNSGNYFVVVTNAFGSVTSTVATLTITNSTAPPTLLSQPQSQSVIASNTAVFSVTAIGALPLAYQWFFNSNVLGGATSPTLTLPNAQPAVAGSYFVVVTNAFGSITSAVVPLTVITSPPPPFQWIVAGGSTNSDQSGGAAADAAGNSYFAGSFVGTMTMGGQALASLGSFDAVFAKLDPAGNVVWLAQGGSGINSDRGLAVAVDGAGNVLGAGRFEGSYQLGSTRIFGQGGDDCMAVKFNSSGVRQWIKGGGGGGDDQATAVAVDGAGNVFLVGNLMGGPTFNSAVFDTITVTNRSPINGSFNGFVAKYNAAGAIQWVFSYGGTTNNTTATGVGTDAAGNAYVAGSFTGTIEFGTNTVTYTAGGTLTDGYLAKITPAGAVAWVRTFPRVSPANIAVRADGTCYLAGRFGGTPTLGPDTLSAPANGSVFVAKFDSTGAPVWARQGTAPGNNVTGAGLAVDAQENVFISGNFNTSITFGGTVLTNAGVQDLYLAKYTAGGVLVWAKRAGGAGDDFAAGIAADAAGNTYLAGSHFTNATFDALSLPATQFGDRSFFMTKISASAGSFPMPSGLTAWWTGDGHALDYVSTNHAQTTNLAFGVGQVQQAFNHDGLGSRFRVPAAPALNVGVGPGFTVEFWLHPRNLAVAQPVVEWHDLTGFVPPGFAPAQAGIRSHLWINIALGNPNFSGALYANLIATNGDNHIFNTAPGLLQSNTWQHVALTYSQASGTVNLLLNGNVVGTTNLPGNPRISTSDDLLAGFRPTGVTGGTFLDGLLDELSLYNRALSQSEIQSIIAAGPAGKARPAAPTILVPPQARTVDQGAPATLDVTAAGFAPFTYQWRLNGTNVPGQTNATLTIPAAYSVHEGSYDVRVTQFDGANVLSQPATLNVLGQGEVKTLFGSTNDVLNFVRSAGGPSQWLLTSSNIVQVVPGTGNIQSTQNFGDFILHAEFLLPASGNGNCGIYLQNRYEIQIFNSFGVTVLGSNDCGAVWGQFPPSTNACLAPGVWQSYDITFRQPQWNGNTKVADARVTVVLNGVTVQDNVAITNRTTGGANEGPTPGPVTLQDNGAPVQFRNVRITPLDLPPDFSWTRQIGSTNAAGNNTDFARDIATDAAGNVYVTGSFFGTASFGPTNLTSAGDIDFFLAKYSPAGALAWVVRGGGPNFDSGQEIAVGPDGNVYVAGLMESGAVFGMNALSNAGGHDLFLAKYAPDGQLVWVRTGGGSADDGPHGLTVDAGTNVYVTGHLQNSFAIGSTNLTSAGQWDSFLAKYNSDGTFQWVRQGSGTDFDYAQGVVADEAGNVYTAITFQSLFSLGATNFNNFAARDLCLVSYDSSGTLRWARQFALPGTRKLGKLRRDPAGNLLLTLNFSSTLMLGTSPLQSAGSEDIFLAKFDPNGTPLWARQGGSTGDDFNTGDLAVDAQGNAYIVTSFVAPATFNATALPNAGNDDVVVAKYDPAGVQLWALSLGSAGTERALGVAVGPDGQAVVGGTFANAIDFRGTTFTSFGGNDGFITKLAEVLPLISQQPVGGNVLAGQNVTFSVTATGAGTLTYQWRLNGTNLVGATNAAYTILNATTNAAGTYDVLITHAFGSVLSSPASITVIPSANPLPFTFAERFGGTGAESVQALARDAAGNSYLAGYFTGALSLGITNLTSAGSDDLFVVKVSPAGAVLWAAHCGGPGQDRATGVALDPNGDVVVVGWFDNNAVFGTNGAVSVPVSLAAFTLRLGASGQLIGFQKIDAVGAGVGSLQLRAFAVAVDAAGSAYVTGTGNETNQFGALTVGRPGIWGFLAKYDRTGAVQWVQASDRPPGASGNVVGQTVALDSTGGVYWGGYYNPTNVTIGGVNLPSGGGADGFIAKFTPVGAPVWTRGLHGPGLDRVLRLAVDAAGNVFAFGDFDAAADYGTGVITPSSGGTTTGLLLKLDASGSVLWAREVGGGAGSFAGYGALATDAAGNAYVAHHFTGTNLLGNPPAVSLGNTDGLVVKFSASGSFLWAQTLGSPGNEFVNGLVLDTNFNLHLAGTLGSAATFGPFVLTNAGSTEMFLARIASVPPVITTQPTSQTIGVTLPVTFTVAAGGTLPFSYQWRFNGTNLPGATNASFTIPAVVPANAGGYSVLVGDALGITNSATATLVVDTSNVPFITGQPQSQSVLQGTAILFNVSAVGAQPLSYQWRRNGTNLAGEVFDFLALGGVSTNANGSYTVVVTNTFGAVTSAPAVLTVTPVFPPVITNHPASLTVLAGSNATFTVAASGTGPFSYQWIRNGVGLPGNDTPSLTITNATLADAGSYFAQVFNSAGLATSSNATLTVHAPPQFLSLPQPVTVLQGATTNFSASASGTPAPAFQWFKDGVRLTNTVGYSGVATPNLLVLDTQGGQAGSYVVVATNAAGAITSAPVTLTVLLAPTITTHPTNVTLTRTNYTNALPVTLSVAASGAPPLLYQWRFNGGDLAGETNTTLTLTNVTRLQNGLYQAVVTNIAGSAASSNALVRVRVAQRVEPPVFTPGTPFRLRFLDDNGELASPADLAKLEVQATTNLAGPATVWVTLTNGLSVVNGMLQLDDPAGTNALRRYYRVIER